MRVRSWRVKGYGAGEVYREKDSLWRCTLQVMGLLNTGCHAAEPPLPSSNASSELSLLAKAPFAFSTLSCTHRQPLMSDLVILSLFLFLPQLLLSTPACTCTRCPLCCPAFSPLRHLVRGPTSCAGTHTYTPARTVWTVHPPSHSIVLLIERHHCIRISTPLSLHLQNEGESKPGGSSRSSALSLSHPVLHVTCVGGDSPSLPQVAICTQTPLKE